MEGGFTAASRIWNRPKCILCSTDVATNFDEDGDFSDDQGSDRIPKNLFGDAVDEALITLQFEMEKKQEEESRLMDLLITKEWKSYSVSTLNLFITIRRLRCSYQTVAFF